MYILTIAGENGKACRQALPYVCSDMTDHIRGETRDHCHLPFKDEIIDNQWKVQKWKQTAYMIG